MEIKKRKIKFFSFGFVTVSTLISSMLHFLLSVYARKFVSVTDYGLFSTCTLLATYLNYLQLGILNSYNRDYPQLKGSGELEKASYLRNTVSTLLLCVYFVVVVLAEVVLFFLYKVIGLDIKLYIGFSIMAPTAFCSVFESYFLISARMDGYLNKSALAVIIKSVISIVVALYIIKLFGYIGLYVATPLASLISVVFLYKVVIINPKFTFDWKLCKSLIISGFPLLINSFIWTVVTSIDKFVILAFFDVDALGYYSISTLAFSTIVIIPSTLSQLFYIKMGEVYGKDKSIDSLVNVTNKYSCLIAFVAGATVTLLYNILPLFVQIVMPHFMDGIEAAQIIMLGIAFYASSILYGNVLTILKLNSQVIKTTIALCIFNLLISSGLVLFNHNIVMVALGTSVSYALYSLLILIKLKQLISIDFFTSIKGSWTPVIIGVLVCAMCYIFNLSYIFGLVLGVSVYIVFGFIFLKKWRQG